MNNCNILQTIFIIIAIIGLILCFTGTRLATVGATMITVIGTIYASIFYCMKKKILNPNTLKINK